MSVESTSLKDKEPVKSSERASLVLSRRTDILRGIFSSSVETSKYNPEESEILLKKDPFGKSSGGNKWSCSFTNDMNVKYSFSLLENSDLQRAHFIAGHYKDGKYTDEIEIERVYIHELEVEIPFKRWEEEKILEEINLKVFLRRSIGGSKGISFESAEGGYEFSLEELSEFPNKEFRQQFAHITKIYSFRGLELNYSEGDEGSIVVLKILF